jgi:hypothetical protein
MLRAASSAWALAARSGAAGALELGATGSLRAVSTSTDLKEVLAEKIPEQQVRTCLQVVPRRRAPAARRPPPSPALALGPARRAAAPRRRRSNVHAAPDRAGQTGKRSSA